MFNLFLRPYIPGFRLKPQDGGPGFDVDENGGLLAATETPRYLAGAQTQTPRPITSFTRGPDVPGSDFIESVVPSQETTWSDGILAPPPGVDDPVVPTPSQLPEWLYALLTMPLPQSSAAFDPRTGQRIAPYAPLIGPVRAYQKTRTCARRQTRRPTMARSAHCRTCAQSKRPASTTGRPTTCRSGPQTSVFPPALRPRRAPSRDQPRKRYGMPGSNA